MNYVRASNKFFADGVLWIIPQTASTLVGLLA